MRQLLNLKKVDGLMIHSDILDNHGDHFDIRMDGHETGKKFESTPRTKISGVNCVIIYGI